MKQYLGGCMKKEYSVGPLLYMPALRTDIADKLREGVDGLRTAAICLEDTIRDDMVTEAENNLEKQIRLLSDSPDGLPDIFIRVREPAQIKRLQNLLGENMRLIDGIVIPKADDENIEDYLGASEGMDIMPIIENPSLMKLSTRYGRLERLHDSLMKARGRVRNVRIGGNDFCKVLSLRADVNQTVYDLLPVADMISDIAAVFAADFTVSAPVWNYFGGDKDWRTGMRREMEIDKSIGLIGKTVIHPDQIAEVNRAMRVTRGDYEDARLILANSGGIQVIKSADGSRMYENKIHSVWAEKILCLGEIYGIAEDGAK